MKKCMMAVMAMILMMSLSGCGKSNVSHDVYSEIYERYSEMQSYTAEAEMTVRSNSTCNTYTIRQYYQAPDRYMMEILAPENLAGTSCVFDGESVYLGAPFGASAALANYVPGDKDYIFIPDFFAEYYNSGETAAAAAGNLSGGQTKLTSVVSGSNRYRFQQSLWVDNETVQPVKLETYDVDGNLVLDVVFTDFQYNKKIDGSVFDIQDKSQIK